jgi:Mce-associated membrane protein
VTVAVEEADKAAEAEKTDVTPAVEEAAPNELASWHIRAAALLVDVLPGIAVVTTMVIVWLTVPLRSAWWWTSISIAVLVLLLMWANRVMQPITGRSLGRALMGIVVVGPDETPVEPWRLLCRDLTHLLDTLSVFVGWLWPLWDPRRRTFADLLLGTEVHRVDPDRRPPGIGRTTATVVSTAALLCIAGAGSGVVAVYLPDRASDQTRATISTQGPKIVTEMLTYDPKSLKEQFARAQSLTTEKYRPQLVKQQETVQKGHPVVNEYWFTDSAVLSATRNKATMLVFLQGHRGGENEQRFITATVRVSFVKARDARWLVDDLTVLTKPKPAKGEK